MSRKALVRSSDRRSATAAIVVCSTRAATDPNRDPRRTARELEATTARGSERCGEVAVLVAHEVLLSVDSLLAQSPGRSSLYASRSARNFEGG